jgi:hypothetical protein
MGGALLAAAIKNNHNGRVRKARVEFKYKRIAEDEWQIEAHYSGAELRHIKGFIGRIDWLRSQGYAK